MEAEDGFIGPIRMTDNRRVKYVIFPRVGVSDFPEEYFKKAITDKDLAEALALLVSRGYTLNSLAIYKLDEEITGCLEDVVVQITLPDGTEVRGECRFPSHAAAYIQTQNLGVVRE